MSNYSMKYVIKVRVTQIMKCMQFIVVIFVFHFATLSLSYYIWGSFS